MPLAEAAAGFRASFILLICAAAGTYAIQGEAILLCCCFLAPVTINKPASSAMQLHTVLCVLRAYAMQVKVCGASRQTPSGSHTVLQGCSLLGLPHSCMARQLLRGQR